MQEIKVDSLEKRQINGKDLLVVKSGNKSYSIWDAKEAAKVSEGQTISCDVDTSGKYWKITKVYEQETEPEPPKQPPKSQPQSGAAPKNDLAILYQTCLNRVVELHVAQMNQMESPAIPNPDSIIASTGTLFEGAINTIKRHKGEGFDMI